MNPISIFYCYNQRGALVASVLQVTNTPWKERTLYVLDVAIKDEQRGDPSKIRETLFDKHMHVSPFNPIDMQYHCRMGVPGSSLFFHLENHCENKKHTDATLCLHRKPLTRSALITIVLLHPVHSLKVLLGIYSNALRLWLKRAPVYDHQPVRDSPSIPSADPPHVKEH